jgi:hypothetical protein
MPIQFKFDARLSCLHTIAHGRVSLEEFLAYHRAIEITNPPANLLILSDYRRLDPSGLKTSDIQQIKSSALGKTERKYLSVKEAMVVAEDLAYGLSRMFAAIAHSDKYHVNVFHDIHAATKWLGLTAGAMVPADASFTEIDLSSSSERTDRTR